jgi:Domain of unknown function (DUF5069)
MSETVFSAPNLSQRPPRSARVRLGGFIILPRILDKCRAVIAGTAGEFKYNGPLDQHFFRFTKLDADALKKIVASGKGDGEILEWIMENAGHRPQPWEILQWSTYYEQRTPDSDAETLQYFASLVAKYSATRTDIKTWLDYLDLDDHMTFGGQA